jgi:hypothetical protein
MASSPDGGRWREHEADAGLLDAAPLMVVRPRSILTPSAVRRRPRPISTTSARLPCLATGTPAPATMKAAQVEMLYESERIAAGADDIDGVGRAPRPCTILARMALTAPVISSTVSPRTRKRHEEAADLAWRCLPDIMMVEGMRRFLAGQRRARCGLGDLALNSSALMSSMQATLRAVPGGGEVEEILQDEMAVFGGDAFGMELHAVQRQLSCARDP